MNRAQVAKIKAESVYEYLEALLEAHPEVETNATPLHTALLQDLRRVAHQRQAETFRQMAVIREFRVGLLTGEA